jgi:hypothetical protein
MQDLMLTACIILFVAFIASCLLIMSLFLEVQPEEEDEERK